MLHLPHAQHGRGHISVSPEETKASEQRGLPFGGGRPPYIWAKPDLIAVTRGPGIGGCLSVGVTTAKALSVAWQVPIIGVHHMQAHALTPLLRTARRAGPGHGRDLAPVLQEDMLKYPFLTLLVSGKHTMLVHTKSAVTHRILASTPSPSVALGDVLDKLARDILPQGEIPSDMESVVYPRLMERFVGEWRTSEYSACATRDREKETYRSEHGWEIPAPLGESRDMRYNFTGFNGCVHKILQERPTMPESERRDLGFDVMRIAFEHLMSRVILALQTDEDLLKKPPKSLVLSGGVASNQFLRKVAQSTLEARGFANVRVVAPDPKRCTDNAVMVAFAGALLYQDGWQTDNDFCPKIDWSIEEILSGVDCWSRREGFGPGKQTDAATERRDQSLADREALPTDSPLESEKKAIEKKGEETDEVTVAEEHPVVAALDGQEEQKSASAKSTKLFPGPSNGSQQSAPGKKKCSNPAVDPQFAQQRHDQPVEATTKTSRSSPRELPRQSLLEYMISKASSDEDHAGSVHNHKGPITLGKRVEAQQKATGSSPAASSARRPKDPGPVLRQATGLLSAQAPRETRAAAATTTTAVPWRSLYRPLRDIQPGTWVVQPRKRDAKTAAAAAEETASVKTDAVRTPSKTAKVNKDSGGLQQTPRPQLPGKKQNGRYKAREGQNKTRPSETPKPRAESVPQSQSQSGSIVGKISEMKSMIEGFLWGRNK